MRYPELLILRHGETEWNVQGRMQGHLDSPLTPTGRIQASDQRRLLQAHGIGGYDALCSPSTRAVHTAALALEGLVPEVRTDPRLREIGMGAWTGLTRDDILARCAEGDWLDDPFALYTHAPQGEGFAALAQRCRALLADLNAPTVLVTHGITSRMLRLILTGGDAKDIGQLHALTGGQGVVYLLRDGGQTRLA